MSDAAPRLASYEDLIALPEDTRAEVIAGQIVTAPAALPRHARAAAAIARSIGGPFDQDSDGPGGWWILPEVDVRLREHDIVRPDVAGWRRERLPEPWDSRPIDVVPDWICEILSPSNAAHDRVTKAELYAGHGVPHFWLVDPAERILEAFELTGGLWTRLGSYDDTAVVRVKPFDELEFAVGRLFPPAPSPR